MKVTHRLRTHLHQMPGDWCSNWVPVRYDCRSLFRMVLWVEEVTKVWRFGMEWKKRGSRAGLEEGPESSLKGSVPKGWRWSGLTFSLNQLGFKICILQCIAWIPIGLINKNPELDMGFKTETSKKKISKILVSSFLYQCFSLNGERLSLWNLRLNAQTECPEFLHPLTPTL